jgi:hypothetical protein
LAVFAVTFRLEAGPDYSTRWQSVVEAVHREAIGDVWEEPTSFFLFESRKSAHDLCHAIYHGSQIYDSRDLILVTNLSLKDYDQKGAKYPNTLSSLMNAR